MLKGSNHIIAIIIVRANPGWDFIPFFTVKEGLAFVYQTFGMYEEALMLYDELEALFSVWGIFLCFLE